MPRDPDLFPSYRDGRALLPRMQRLAFWNAMCVARNIWPEHIDTSRPITYAEMNDRLATLNGCEQKRFKQVFVHYMLTGEVLSLPGED